MKPIHALGFFLLGAVMLVLPQSAPSLFPRTGFDGTSGRELWVQVMGLLQTGLGASTLCKTILRILLHSFKTWTETLQSFFASRRHPTVPAASLAPVIDSGIRNVSTPAFAPWPERRAA